MSNDRTKALTAAVASAAATPASSDDSVVKRPVRAEKLYSGKTFEEIQALDALEPAAITREKTASWRQKLRHMCDPRIIRDLLESPIAKERMEALKFCAQYGYGMPDKIVAAAVLVQEEKSISINNDVLRTAMETLAGRVIDVSAGTGESTDSEDESKE